MRLQRPELIHLFAAVSASALTMGLAACGGNPGAASAAEAPAPAPAVITQSTISLPQSVQVVSAK